MAPEGPAASLVAHWAVVASMETCHITQLHIFLWTHFPSLPLPPQADTSQIKFQHFSPCLRLCFTFFFLIEEKVLIYYFNLQHAYF